MLIRSGAGCPACGAAHASCGPAGTGTPVDLPTRKDRAMGPIRKYHVTHNGHRTIMKLNDADVKLYPDAEPVDDARTDTGAQGSEDTAEKGRTAANKRRTPANKADA